MRTNANYYDAGITGKKGVKEAGWGSAASWIAVWAVGWLVHFGMVDAGDQVVAVGIGTGVVAGVLKMGRNWLTAHGVAFGWMGPLTMLAVFLLPMLVGCATMVNESTDGAEGTENYSKRKQVMFTTALMKTDFAEVNLDEGIDKDGNWYRKQGSAAKGVDGTSVVDVLLGVIAMQQRPGAGPPSPGDVAAVPGLVTVEQFQGVLRQLNETWAPQLQALRAAVDEIRTERGPDQMVNLREAVRVMLREELERAGVPTIELP